MADEKIVLKPANRAALVYQSGSASHEAPRQAHQFVVTFGLQEFGGIPPHLKQTFTELKEFKDRLHFLVNVVDQPKMSVDQSVLNQYNRKRIVNRTISFDPVSMRMYDTHDGLGIKLARFLYEFEFQGARLYKKNMGADDEMSEQHNYQDDLFQTDEQFKQHHHFGLAPHLGRDSRILKYIDIYQVAGGQFSKVRCVYPRLSRLDLDTLDYSSSAIVNISLAFQYENFMFEETNVDIGEAEADISGMMSTTSDFKEVAGGPDAAPPTKISKDKIGYGEGKVDPGLAKAVNSSAQSSLSQAKGQGFNTNDILNATSNAKASVISGVKNAGKSVAGFLGFGKG